MRLALVTNAKSGREDRGDTVRATLRDAGAHTDRVSLEETPGWSGPADRVVVVGGDGSVGPAAALAARLGVALAVVPAGTANDFARWLGLPLDVEAAARLAADPAARTRTVELAEDAAGRPFVNVASAGLSVLAAENAAPLKPRLGKLAYTVGALRAGVAGRPLHVTVRTDGRIAFQGDAWQVVVAATGAFGGGSATGGVDPHDHALDVAIVRAGSRLKLVRRALAMRNRRLVHDPDVEHVRGRTIEVEGADTFNVDGEVCHPRPARFTVRDTLAVVVPA